jgi:hypothetical protein
LTLPEQKKINCQFNIDVQVDRVELEANPALLNQWLRRQVQNTIFYLPSMLFSSEIQSVRRCQRCCGLCSAAFGGLAHAAPRRYTLQSQAVVMFSDVLRSSFV